MIRQDKVRGVGGNMAPATQSLWQRLPRGAVCEQLVVWCYRVIDWALGERVASTFGDALFAPLRTPCPPSSHFVKF